MNVTNDLAIGLKTDLDIAEQVRVKFAGLGESRPRGYVHIEHDGKKHQFEAEDVHIITEARIEELLELVDKELKKIHRSRKLPGGVVFVGGTANLPGLAEFAKEQLQLAARIGVLQPVGGLVDTVQDPAYTTAVGLMTLDMLLGPSNQSSGMPNSAAFGLIEGLFKKFKRP
jgi:cell division protein FtsA